MLTVRKREHSSKEKQQELPDDVQQISTVAKEVLKNDNNTQPKSIVRQSNDPPVCDSDVFIKQ
jgi:hypothetical protein